MCVCVCVCVGVGVGVRMCVCEDVWREGRVCDDVDDDLKNTNTRTGEADAGERRGQTGSVGQPRVH